MFLISYRDSQEGYRVSRHYHFHRVDVSETRGTNDYSGDVFCYLSCNTDEALEVLRGLVLDLFDTGVHSECHVSFSSWHRPNILTRCMFHGFNWSVARSEVFRFLKNALSEVL